MPVSPRHRVESLYVHVPFCARKCDYCAFYSEAADAALVNRYVAALLRELELAAHDLKPRTVFFGGGTPSLLNLRQWEHILDAFHRLRLDGAQEWTVECNPATVSLEKARLLRAHGVNRISMGVQSLDDALLDRLGRVHSRDSVFRSFDTLRQAGFDNINLDLMFAIPGQTMESWRATLETALSFGSEHLSCYEVIYEEDTPLFAQLQAGEFDVDEDLACDMYDELLERADAAGLRQYEVANFARDRKIADARPALADARFAISSPRPGIGDWRLAIGDSKPDRSPAADPIATPAPLADHRPRANSIPFFACRHNVNYWRGGSFYGLGPSATSYVRGVRTKNWSNTRMYCEQLERGTRAIETREELPPLARAGEAAAFGLRLVAGWPFAEFRRVTGHDLRREWAAEMDQLAGRNWARISPDRFQLTREGLRFADSAAELFLRTTP